MVRLADALGTGLGRAEPRAAQGPRRCAAGCSACSARRWRWATTWSPTRDRGTCWRATSRCRRPTSCARTSPRLAEIGKRTQRLRCRRCARCTATGCWCWRRSTSRRPWRTSRCCRSPTVGAHLSDLADAALAAALTVATRSVCGEDGETPRLAVIAMGKCGARELNYVSDVDVIFVAEDGRRDSTHQGGRGDDAVRGGRVLRGRRGAAAGGQARSAGAHAGLARRLLRAVGQDVGVPGADEGAARGGRRRARRAVHRGADADGVDGLRARGLRARGAGDAPPRRGAGARRRAGPRAQARHRRAARRRVRRAAAAARARPQRRIAARRVDGRRAGRAGRRAATSAATTPPT